MNAPEMLTRRLLLKAQGIRWFVLILMPMVLGVSFADAADGVTQWLYDPFATRATISTDPSGAMFAAQSACQFSDQLPAALSVMEAVARALCRNPQTRRAWAEVKYQAAAVGVGHSAYLPTVNATASMGRLNQEIHYPGFAEGDTALHAKTSAFNLSMNWVLYDFGLREANLENARQLFNAAQASQHASLQKVWLETAQIYFDCQAAEALHHASLTAEQASQQNLQAAEARYNAGVGTLADKLQAETTHAQAVLRQVQALGEWQTKVGSLAVQMGLRPNTPLQLSELPQIESTMQSELNAVDRLIVEATAQHPKIRAAAAEFAAAQAQVGAVRAQGLPVLSLYASGDRNETPANQSVREVVTSRSIGVQITIPLFEGLARGYKITSAQTALEKKQLELEEVTQQVALEVWQSYSLLKKAFADLQASNTLLTSARQSYAVAEGRYKAGVGTILELLKAQTDLASADQQRIQTIAQWHSTKIRLAASLGQWQFNLENTVGRARVGCHGVRWQGATTTQADAC